jgi:hypothetical protein
MLGPHSLKSNFNVFTILFIWFWMSISSGLLCGLNPKIRVYDMTSGLGSSSSRSGDLCFIGLVS